MQSTVKHLTNMCLLDCIQVRELSREDIEKDLTFVGFVIISCPLKPDSKAVVREIRDASHHVSLLSCLIL